MAIWRAWCQNIGGIEAWARRVQMMLFIVRIFLSTFPFWGEVWGEENLKDIPFCSQDFWKRLLSYSLSLSHWNILLGVQIVFECEHEIVKKWNRLVICYWLEKSTKNQWSHQEITHNNDAPRNLTPERSKDHYEWCQKAYK